MNIKCVIYTKQKSGESKFKVHYVCISETDITELAREKFLENPPTLFTDNMRIDSISIDNVKI
jgi:hypothetical protein